MSKNEHDQAFVAAKRLIDDNARLRALISWIDGVCVDNEPGLDMTIREAINRYWLAAGVVVKDDDTAATELTMPVPIESLPEPQPMKPTMDLSSDEFRPKDGDT